MIIPAVFDATIYHRYAPPELGTTGYWGLFWNDEFAKRWARLRPQWRLSATLEDLVPELQMVENEPVRHACSARGPGFSIKCRINGDPPRLITLAGATRVLKAPTNSLRSGESDTATSDLTHARVIGMQLVTFDLGLQTRYGPFRYRDGIAEWQSLGHMSGSEKIEDITRAPDELRTLPGDASFPRLELLLLDLETT